MTTTEQAVRVLRDYQAEAYQAVRDAWAAGTTRPAVVHATGLGKGDMIGKMAADERAAGGDVLILAHREEILTQLDRRCRAYDPDARVGLVMGTRTQRQHRITAASIQTVGRRLRRMRDADPRDRARIERKMPRQPTLIIVDECHRAVSDTYLEVLAHYGAHTGTRMCGYTATMIRGDRRGLGDIWQDAVDKRSISWAVEHGHLVTPRGRVVVADHINLNDAKVSRGDYQDNDLGEMVVQDTEQIVAAWQQHASDRITIAFVPTVAAAEALAAEFVGAGVACEVVTGTTGREARNATYARLAAGTTRVLVNVFVLVEGWDCPPVSCVLMARPTKLPGVYQQAVGRGLRHCPEIGKRDCLVLDVVGTSRTQRLVTLADLHPSSVIDTSEVDDLPCDVCGRWPSAAAADRHGGDPDDVCQCVAEPGERDPDGGRRRLIGPAQYEDLDLVMRESGCVWLALPDGIPILPAGDRTALLWRDDETDLYQAGHIRNRDERGEGVDLDGTPLHDGLLPFRDAMKLAETWAVDYAPTVASKGASWRRGTGGTPSEAQQSYARRLGIAEPERYGKARLSDEISIAIVDRRLAG